MSKEQLKSEITGLKKLVEKCLKIIDKIESEVKE